MEVVTQPSTYRSAMVGRSEELSQLRSSIGLDRSRGQGGGTVVVSGEAGVGKTRLLSELGEAAEDAGWRVLVGRCLDFADGALSYLPFSQVLAVLGTQSPEVLDRMNQDYPELRHLMPGQRLLADQTRQQPEPTVKTQLFEALHGALEELAATAPLLVVIEDLHWADTSTREMLTFLFARQFTQPMALVASYRSDDMHRRHPLRYSIAEWARIPGVHRLRLQPLVDSDVRTLVRSLRGHPLQETHMQAIVSRAEGNAFFVEELVAASEAGGSTIPDDLSDLLLVRLDRIDPAARTVVRAAAVAGRRVSHQLLARVVDLDAGELDSAIRAAVESNILVPGATSEYAFRHALLAEAVYDDLLPGERIRLHAAYAAALRSHDIPGTAAELARHARESHDVNTALAAAARAGDDAMTVGGPDEAAQHYLDALELMAGPGADPDLAPLSPVGLTVKAATALTASGRPHRAVSLVHDYLLRNEGVDTPEERGRALLALANAAIVDETDVDPLEATTEALQLIPADPPSPLRASLLAMHARANMERDRNDDAMRWAEKAVAMAGDLGLDTVKADAKTTLAKLLDRAGNPDESLRTLEGIFERALTDGDPLAELRALFSIGGLHFTAARYEAALTVYQRASRRAEELGRPWGPYGIDARLMAGVTAFYMGDWATARTVTDVTGQRPPAVGEACLAALSMAPAAGQGDTSALDLIPHIRAQWHRDGLVAILTGAAAIDLYGDSGRLEQAVAIYDDVVTSVSQLWQNPTFHARVRLSGLVLGQLARYIRDRGPAADAALVRRTEEFVQGAEDAFQRHTRLGVVGPESRAWMSRVRAEHLRVAWWSGTDVPEEEQLVGAWEDAVAAFIEFRHEFELARTRARLAEVLRATGRTAEAAEVAAEARRTAERLGARPLLEELASLRTAARQRGTGAPDEATLTDREQQILALVAQGRSNGEIGKQLFISTKTVSVHVSHVLRKLQARSRTEAAAIARSRGLL